MNKKSLFIAAAGIILITLIVLVVFNRESPDYLVSSQTDFPNNFQSEIFSEPQIHELSVETLRAAEYPGSEIVIEEDLPNGSNYKRHIASYQSEGNKIYGLLTVPLREKPPSGWPVIIFNHGYIPPAQYRTTERYVAYTDAFSRNGYIVFKSDYRGHGISQGEAAGGYGSNAYTIDILNALSSVKKHPDADPRRIGMWGHSMGGHITLRSMVVDKDIKAGVIWGGVVASYPDLIERWRRRNLTPRPMPSGRGSWRDLLTETYGSPAENPRFWSSISANSYLSNISGPLELHHGENDTSVPVEFSRLLKTQLDQVGKKVNLFTYPGDDHNISRNFSTAINRSVEFFDKYVKGLP